MSDQAAFLDAIRRDPDDDTLRLVYADWLDENADGLTDVDRAHAEYIRLSCGYGKWAAVDEQQWIASNWRRFVPHFCKRFGVVASGISHAIVHESVAYTDVQFGRPQVCFRFSRGIVHGVYLQTVNIDDVVPVAVDDCPLAKLSVLGVIRTSRELYDKESFRVYDFAPRSIWQSIQGHDATGTDGIHDYLVFAGERPLTRASAALSDALRKYGEQVNFYRSYSESMTGIKGGRT